MIDGARERATQVASFLACAPDLQRSTSSRSTTDSRVRDDPGRHAAPTSGSTAASSSSARDLRLHRAGRRARRGAVRAPDRRRGARSPIRYDGFWAPMDTIKDKQRLEACYESGQAPWRVWEDPRTASRTAPDAPRVMLRLHSAGAGGQLRSRARDRRHADDIEIGCGGTLLRLVEAHPELEVAGSCSRRRATRADEARASADDVPARRRRRRESCVEASATASSRTTGAEVKECFEELKADVSPGPDPHALARRPPPGSPARLRADLEHVPRPPDPRVRDPEVRRRPRAAERLRPRSSEAIVAAQGRPAARRTSPRSAASTGSPQTVPRADAPPRDGVRTRPAATPRRSTAASSSCGR